MLALAHKRFYSRVYAGTRNPVDGKYYHHFMHVQPAPGEPKSVPMIMAQAGHNDLFDGDGAGADDGSAAAQQPQGAPAELEEALPDGDADRSEGSAEGAAAAAAAAAGDAVGDAAGDAVRNADGNASAAQEPRAARPGAAIDAPPIGAPIGPGGAAGGVSGLEGKLAQLQRLTRDMPPSKRQHVEGLIGTLLPLVADVTGTDSSPPASVPSLSVPPLGVSTPATTTAGAGLQYGGPQHDRGARPVLTSLDVGRRGIDQPALTERDRRQTAPEVRQVGALSSRGIGDPLQKLEC